VRRFVRLYLNKLPEVVKDKKLLARSFFINFIDILIVVQYYLKAGIPVISIPVIR
jgi:hypothetical protein